MYVCCLLWKLTQTLSYNYGCYVSEIVVTNYVLTEDFPLRSRIMIDFFVVFLVKYYKNLSFVVFLLFFHYLRYNLVTFELYYPFITWIEAAHFRTGSSLVRNLDTLWELLLWFLKYFCGKSGPQISITKVYHHKNLQISTFFNILKFSNYVFVKISLQSHIFGTEIVVTMLVSAHNIWRLWALYKINHIMKFSNCIFVKISLRSHILAPGLLSAIFQKPYVDIA